MVPIHKPTPEEGFRITFNKFLKSPKTVFSFTELLLVFQQIPEEQRKDWDSIELIIIKAMQETI